MCPIEMARADASGLRLGSRQRFRQPAYARCTRVAGVAQHETFDFTRRALLITRRTERVDDQRVSIASELALWKVAPVLLELTDGSPEGALVDCALHRVESGDLRGKRPGIARAVAGGSALWLQWTAGEGSAVEARLAAARLFAVAPWRQQRQRVPARNDRLGMGKARPRRKQSGAAFVWMSRTG